MNLRNFLFWLLVSTIMVSCKNYYNETIDWMDNLESGLTVKEVIRNQPKFIKIDWDNFLVVDDQKWYLIDKIKGNRDVLGMSHYLVFIDDKFQYRISKK